MPTVMIDAALVQVVEDLSRQLAHVSPGEPTAPTIWKMHEGDPTMPAQLSDAVLIRILDEMLKSLSRVDPHFSTDEVIPSYNALLAAAKASHPDVVFLDALQPIAQSGVNAGPIVALMSQLKVILEALQEG